MAMVQTVFRTRTTSYCHSSATVSQSHRAEMSLFQAFLRPSFMKIIDWLCIKDGTTIEIKTRYLIQNTTA